MAFVVHTPLLQGRILSTEQPSDEFNRTMVENLLTLMRLRA